MKAVYNKLWCGWCQSYNYNISCNDACCNCGKNIEAEHQTKSPDIFRIDEQQENE